MKPLRIAVYHNLHSGGAKRVAAEHLRRLSERHTVTLYSLRGADHTFASVGTRPGHAIRLYDYAARPWLRSPFGRLNTVIGVQNIRRMDALGRRIARDIDAAQHDVVLAHPCQMTFAPTVLKWLQTPSLYYLHEMPRRYYEPRIDRPYDTERASSARLGAQRVLNRLDPLVAYNRHQFCALDKASAQAATRIATNSAFTQQNAEPVYRRTVDVCYLGVNAAQYASNGPAPVSESQHAREPIVLSVGSLTPAKGFDFIIQALGTLPRDARGCRPPLVIISNFQEAPERDYLIGLAHRHDVPLKLLVRVSDDELRDWYARAACVAYTPVREPFGLVALEAMAASAPVLAVAEGGVRETVIDGVTGLLAPREPQAFGRAVQTLLDDPEQAQRLGLSARAHVAKHWTWEQHIERLERMLEAVAD